MESSGNFCTIYCKIKTITFKCTGWAQPEEFPFWESMSSLQSHVAPIQRQNSSKKSNVDVVQTDEVYSRKVVETDLRELERLLVLSWLWPGELVTEMDGVDGVWILAEHGDHLGVQHGRGDLGHLRHDEEVT